MTTKYPWDDQEETKPVDSAGCEWGEIERPAEIYMTKHAVELKVDTNAWMASETPVDLEANR